MYLMPFKKDDIIEGDYCGHFQTVCLDNIPSINKIIVAECPLCNHTGKISIRAGAAFAIYSMPKGEIIAKGSY